MRLLFLATLLYFVGLSVDLGQANVTQSPELLNDDATRIALLESRLESLESTIAELQSTQARLLAALSSEAKVQLESLTSPIIPSEAQEASAKRDDISGGNCNGEERLSVCVAIPCIPRHLSSLRDVLLDIRLQTVLPQEVVVSLSETEPSDGPRLAAELFADVFGSQRPNGLQLPTLAGNTADASPYVDKLSDSAATLERLQASRSWPKLTILASPTKQSHADNNNLAASACTSDIISWFDADDRMHPRRLEVLEASFRVKRVHMVLHGLHNTHGANERIGTFLGALSSHPDFGPDPFAPATHAFPTTQETAALTSLPMSHQSIISAILDEKDAQDRKSINEVPDIVVGTSKKGKYNEEAAFFSLLASVFGLWESGSPPVLKEWPESTWRAWNGEQIYDAYAQVDGGLLESYTAPFGADNIFINPVNGHVSVLRSSIWDNLGLHWNDDVDTLGQKFGEDVRFVKSVLKALGRSNTTAALVAANLTLYQPSWASNKRCVLGPHILFDCKVITGRSGEPEVDYSSYDTVYSCPKGTQPGLYIDEDAFHKGVRCVSREERATLATGIRYLDDEFVGIENEDKMSTHQVKIRDSERERLGDQYTIDS